MKSIRKAEILVVAGIIITGITSEVSAAGPNAEFLCSLQVIFGTVS